MKVIFLKDVPDVARAGEIKDVANGYARNYLIPQKLATIAVAETINLVEARIASQARSEAKTETELLELASQIEGKEVVIEARSGGKDKLYGSVTTMDIASRLESQGIVIDRRKIVLDKPIKKLGEFDVPVKIYPQVTGLLKVAVVSEKDNEDSKRDSS